MSICHHVLRKELSDSETFASYRQQILWKQTEFHHLLSGSFFELPGNYILANLTDVDRMRIHPKIQAMPRDAKLSDDKITTVLFIDTHASPVGYCRLENPNYNEFHTKSRIELHGPARKMLLSDWLDVGYKISDGTPRLLKISQLTLDQVDAIFCPYWPPEATDWITRTSVSGWPEKNLKDHIVRGGCHLVAKSHHTQPDDDTQWRYSFSQAEIILINSWNDVQMYLYHILRVIKGRIAKKCKTNEKSIFKNYMFKTLMLRASEEKEPEFWREECIATSVVELLCQAIECLIDRKCEHYFIPKVNILDHSPDIDTDMEISSLEEHTRKLQSIMSLFPKYDEKTGMKLELSRNFVVHYQLRANAQFVINPLSLTFERYFDNELENEPLFRLELETLFKGLQRNLELRSSQSVTYRIEYEKSVTDCFKACFEDNSSNHFRSVLYSNESFHVFANKLFNVGRCLAHVFPQSDRSLPKVDESYNSRKVMDELSKTEASTLFDERSYLSPQINEPATHHGRTNGFLKRPIDSERNSESDNHRNHLSFCSLVLSRITDLYKKPFYLIGLAYYANYFYTYQKKYDIALDLCRETLGYIENTQSLISSGLQTRMHEEIFPVIFGSYWMPLFDENVQVVFGLFLLTVVVMCSEGIPLTSFFWIPSPASEKEFSSRSVSVRLDSVMRSSSGVPAGKVQRGKGFRRLLSSVFVQVSAVEFIRYIGFQCQKHLHLDRDGLFDLEVRQPSERFLVIQSLLLLAAASFETSKS